MYQHKSAEKITLKGVWYLAMEQWHKKGEEKGKN